MIANICKHLVILLFMISPFILIGQVDTNQNNFKYSSQQKLLNTSDEGFGFYEITPYKGFSTPYSSVSDSEGNLFITGSSSNDGKPTSDFLTIKINSQGELLWESRSNTTDYVADMGIVITLDGDGNPVVAASTWNGHDMDIETVKYDKLSGERHWTAVWDGNAGGLDTPVDIAIDNDGNVIVAGYSYQNSPERNEFTTVKISSGGEILWGIVDSFEEQGLSLFPSSIAVGNNGNIAITGFGWKLFNNQSQGYQTYYTIQYSPDGNELWKDNYLIELEGGNEEMIKANSSVKDIEFDQNGNCYVLGNYSADRIPSTIGIIKYRPDGQKEWFQSYQNNENWTKGQVLKITDNTLYLTGRYYDHINTDGVVLVAYDLDGSRKWEKELNGFMEIMDRNTFLTLGHDDLPVFCGFGVNYDGDMIKVKVAKYSEEGNVLNSYEYNPGIQQFRDIKNISTNQQGNVYISMESEDPSQGTVIESVKLDISSENNNLVWKHIYANQGTSATTPISSVSDENGNTYVLGEYKIVNNTDPLLVQIFLTKYDSHGQIEWHQNVESTNMSKAFININSVGELIITVFPLYEEQGNLKIKKYSDAGALLWSKEKQLNSASINSVISDEQGNIVIGGSAKENISDSNVSFLLIKFSSQGNELYTKYINSGDETHNIYGLSKIKIDSNHNIVAVGNFGYGNFWSGVFLDIAILQINQEGNVNWWTSIPAGNFSANARDLYIDIENNIYVVGNTQAPVLAKLTSQGEIEWQRTYIESEREITFYDIKALSNGNLVVSASSAGGGFDPVSGMPFNQIAIIKYSSDGEEQNVVHTEVSRYYKEMYVDNHDNVYLLNTIQSTPVPYREPYWIGPLYQAGLFVLDSDGNANELILGGPNVSQYEPVSLNPHPDGRLLVMGRLFHEYGMYVFSGVYLFETTHETLNVNDSPYLSQSGNILGQNYPNPTSGNTAIPFRIEQNGKVSIRLYDSAGKFVKTLAEQYFPSGENVIKIDLSGMPKGVYFYQFKSHNFMSSRKIILK